MAWLEITIDTATEKINSVVTVLTAKGFADLVIEDQEEFETFLEENRAYWDYIDESLQEKLQGLSRIKLYLEDTDKAKWHYYEYLDWDTSADVTFPESPADGQKGKHIIVIVHGAHAWTTCYSEAMEAACEALGMTCDIYDPNWDQATQDGYVDQAINEQPDAIILIPVSADHAAQQFKKITDAGIPAFCTNTLP